MRISEFRLNLTGEIGNLGQTSIVHHPLTAVPRDNDR